MGLFLRLAGNNLGADNTPRSCNLVATPTTESACSFSYTFSREGSRSTCNGERGLRCSTG